MKPTILFSKSACPRCTIQKKRYEIAKHPFVEVSLDGNNEARDWAVQKGYKHLPVLIHADDVHYEEATRFADLGD